MSFEFGYICLCFIHLQFPTWLNSYKMELGRFYYCIQMISEYVRTKKHRRHGSVGQPFYCWVNCDLIDKTNEKF